MSKYSACCGNCDWYKEFIDVPVCTNPDKETVMEKKNVSDWCDKYSDRKEEDGERE